MKIIKKIKYPLTIIIIVILIIGTILLKRKLNSNKYSKIAKNYDVIIEKEVQKAEPEAETCSIDIKGAVKNPGVYILSCDSNINNAIEASGGLKENADTSLTNLAKKISNEMVIIIYTKEEVKNSNIVNTVIKEVDKECVCPNIQNDGCINDGITSNIGENTGLININTASKDELLTIPGIGESKAKAIISYRETNGKFKKIEDIQNVDGIGSKLYEEIKAYITT